MPWPDALSHPERSLGAPPPGVGGAGRMNARGVSVFYGATNVQTAIAEVRPPVGSLVVSATFRATRELRLLNLGALNDICPNQALSYFQPERMEQGQRCAFPAALREQLLLPVMPEMVDQGYLITQAIADFLSTHPKLNLDGILFPSIQVSQHGDPPAGHNVILFTKASGMHRCEEAYAAGLVSLWDSTEDGTFFTPPSSGHGKISPTGQWMASIRGIQPKRYPPAIELIRSEISIHQVKGVLSDTKDTEVDYHGDSARCHLKGF
ncbi:RES family NAD+ phosphorylase [Pseudomonas sp. NPDC088414]|uniref:RES family NAD+ phosphorylase n=1 Tax=Pseudomonas sp. NPDC088414 TaxID=3364454 RepID=UPI00382D13ED